jgi:hypothetical protein
VEQPLGFAHPFVIIGAIREANLLLVASFRGLQCSQSDLHQSGTVLLSSTGRLFESTAGIQAVLKIGEAHKPSLLSIALFRSVAARLGPQAIRTLQ